MEGKQEPRRCDEVAADVGNAACALDLSIKRETGPEGHDDIEGKDLEVTREIPASKECSPCSAKFKVQSAKFSSSLEETEHASGKEFLPTVLDSTVNEEQCSKQVLPDPSVGDGGGATAGDLEDIAVGTHQESTEGTDGFENPSSAIHEGGDTLDPCRATSACLSSPVGESEPPALPREDSTSPCTLKVEPRSPSSQSVEHGSNSSPFPDSTFPELVRETEPSSSTLTAERTFNSTSGTTTSATSLPVPMRLYSSMLPILSVPKVRLRQDRTEGGSSWTRLPMDSSPQSVGGYFLDRSGESSSFSGEPSGLNAMDYSNMSQSLLPGSGGDDFTARPSLLQMALEHGSTQVNMPGNSKETEEQRELRHTRNSVGTCPTLPINPKNVTKAKPRTKTREKRYYQCEHCNIIYEQPRKLDRHLRDLHGKSPYQCCYCEMSFPTLGCRRFHSRLHEDKTMPCPYCPKVFYEKRRYEDHVRSHTGEAPFMCQECGNVYRTRSALRIHKRTHGNDKPLKCRFCPKRFIRIGDVQVHERTHTGEKPYKCGICESSFATSSQVNRHRRTHSEERPHECSYCNKTFKNPDYLITHEKMHLGHKPHHCKYCPKQFRTPRELVHHERVHTGEKPFECQQCGHRFSKKTNLKQHELQHTGVKSFKCAKCPKSFYRKASLIWHEKIHENRERFLCKECGKLFFKESSRDKHIRKAHGADAVGAGGESGEGTCDGLEEESVQMDGGEEEVKRGEIGRGEPEGGESSEHNTPEPSPTGKEAKRTPPKTPTNDGTDSTCEDCGKTFLARRSLLRHYRAIHNRYISRNGDGDSPGTKPKKSFSCRICSETFLTDHLRHVHEGTHTNACFTCETCSKTFSTRQLLVKHQKIHSDVKPHVCETCGSAFTIKWYLNRHINIVHSDVYSYPCTICDKKFKAKTALSVHMQLHNVEGKVYNCDQCDAEFHVKRYLARHKRKYHRGKDSAKSSRHGKSKRKEEDDDDDDDPMYDFDDNMDDGFDLMTDDSQAVSGVFLRQMLSKGSDLGDFNKQPKQINNHDISNSQDVEKSLNNHEPGADNEPFLGVTPKGDNDNEFVMGDGFSPKQIASNHQEMDHEDNAMFDKNRLTQRTRDTAGTSKEIDFEDGFDASDEENDNVEAFDDNEYDGDYALDGETMSDYDDV